ncbi:hypothetical protein DD902_17470, partial [Staphylococcus pseudintermedius]
GGVDAAGSRHRQSCIRDSIAIGYEMQDNPDHNHIEVQINSELVPRWYVEYDGEWYVYNDGRLE